MDGVISEYDLSECPVCQEDYNDPKLLPCGHIICRECVLSWVKAKQQQNNCPVCRANIVLHQSPDKTINVDIASLIDDFPTDVAVVAVVECKQLLKGNHVCNVCDVDSPAASICIDCNIKLCASCSRTHRKFPAFLEHCLEQLSTLTPERLAALRKSFCDAHKNRPAELYCPTDQSLICFLCSSSNHRSCAGVQVLADFAKNERLTFKAQIYRLRQMKNAIEKQMNQLDIRANDLQSQTEALKHKVNDTIDGLKAALDRRRQELYANIDSEKDGILACLKTQTSSFKGHHTSLAAHVYAAERLLNTAADGSLLLALPNLKISMDALEKQENSAGDNRSMLEIRFDPETITHLESVVSTFGQLVFIPTETTGKPAPSGITAASIQTPLTTPSNAVTAIDKDQIGQKDQPAVQRPCMDQTVYHSRICRESQVTHETGILSYKGGRITTPASQFVGQRPLTPECNKFSIVIIDQGRSREIAIGLCPQSLPANILPGWTPQTVGYHADNGGIYLGAVNAHAQSQSYQCKKGDVMRVEFDFAMKCAKFYKNSSTIFITDRLEIPEGGFYPIVGMHSPGEAVRLLQEEPWKPALV